MQGHGYTQPAKRPPSTGVLVLLRVLFVVLSVFSFGMLAWIMMLRLAVVTRKALDWGLFTATIVLLGLGLYLLGSESGDEIHTPGGWTGLLLLLGTLVLSIAYYLAADVRHFHRLRYAGYPPPHPHTPAYGYPQPQQPYAATPVPQTPPPPAHTPVPRPPLAGPPPQRPPGPARIDQVRAELDELSDYLRRHDGNHEGGR